MANIIDTKLIDAVLELNACGSTLTDLAEMANEHRELKDGFWLALEHLYKGIKLLKEMMRKQLK